jgi:chaperonin GroES
MTNKLPEPQGWRLLIRKEKPPEKSAGGVILSDMSKEAENFLNITGYIEKIGSLCWTDKDRYPSGPWAKVGDKVIIPKYTKFLMEIDNVEYRIINEDEIIAVVDPNTVIKVYS